MDYPSQVPHVANFMRYDFTQEFILHCHSHFFGGTLRNKVIYAACLDSDSHTRHRILAMSEYHRVCESTHGVRREYVPDLGARIQYL